MESAFQQTDYRETLKRLTVASDGDKGRTHIRSALGRGLPEFQPTLIPHDGNMVMCASGPSVAAFIDQIREERRIGRPICAVNGAHDLLCEHGIEPDMFVSVDPRTSIIENVRKKNDRTLYHLSSRCHPELFDWLVDRKVILFHSYSHEEKGVPELQGRTMTGGGTTSGLRAITLGYLMGFKKFILYGYDSCLSNDMRKRFYGPPMKPEQTVDRIVGGQRFMCNAAMAMQADEFQEYYKMLHGITFDIKGDGLLAAIVAERKRLGRRT
jgi:uncharacterized Rossmann fold enzyme